MGSIKQTHLQTAVADGCTTRLHRKLLRTSLTRVFRELSQVLCPQNADVVSQARPFPFHNANRLHYEYRHVHMPLKAIGSVERKDLACETYTFGEHGHRRKLVVNFANIFTR